MQGPRGRNRNRRTHAHYRMEAHELYRHLRQYAEAGRAIQVSRGRWRAQSHRGAVTVSDRPADRPVPRLARASARKRAYTADETNERDEHLGVPDGALAGTVSEGR